MDMPTFEELIKQIKYNFWLSGIPFNDSKLSFRFYFLSLNLSLMIVEESSFLVSKGSEDLLVFTQLLPCCCIGLLSLLKMVALAAKKQTVFELTISLNHKYNEILTDHRKRNLVRRNVILVQILIKYFFILNALLISVYNFSTLVFMGYDYLTIKKVAFDLPYDIIVPFRTDTWPTWFIIYIHSIWCGFICVLYYTTVDALYCILTSHICNHFAIITDQIRRLDANSSKNLKQIVKSHQYILKLSDDLEDIFSLPNLFNVLVGSLEICALGFNLTMGDWTQVPGCVLFLVSVLLQILMMSIFGENIIRESKKVGDAAYTCKWYEMDQTSKKIIFTIMIRSHKYTRLTAYKFSEISYRSFTKIIGTSWSYFTLLKTVYKPEVQTD